jgi:amino acid adenylation domain-containing protein
LFEADSVARMAAHLQTLLEGVAANPQRRLSSLLLLPEEEWLQLLAAWQSLETDYPHDMPISALFEAQVKQTPDAVAVVFDNEQLTYQALDRRADQLAAHLHRLSVRPEAFVGVCVERSLEMIVAVLGILKAGAAYVPLDPSYPPERLALLLADTRASALLTQKHVGDSLKYEGPVICLDDNEWTIAQDSQAGKENAVGRATGLNAACIIYTSGSTGQPKGVVLEHRGIVNLIHSFIHSYQPTTQDKILPLTSVSSASFVGEIFPLLCVGGTLVLPQEEQVLDLESLFDLMARQAVSIISTVPAVVASLNVRKDSLPDVRLILSGGEALGASDVESLLGSTTIVNGYGLTETTICSTFYNLKPEDFHANAWVPIGHPIINTEVYVLDSDLNCLPIGCRGELYVAGDGLARGYWGNPELTAECFVPNPYEMGQRMYRTGDMARWLPDGALEYLHRADHQVKIRGYRIEIGEVESTIRRHPAVRDAYVMIRQDTSGDGQTSSGDKRMVAYVVPAGQALTTSDLYQWLKEKLPLYMVPSAFVLLETLPLLPNGKVDVRALPAPEGTRPSLVMAYAAPQSEAERAIAAIWQAVLKIEQVGIHDNFFELGGNSLLIAQAHHRLREELKCDLSLVDMFKYPTVSALAQHISREQSQAPLYQDVKEQAQKRKQALRQREQRVKQRLRS